MCFLNQYFDAQQKSQEVRAYFIKSCVSFMHSLLKSDGVSAFPDT